MRNIELQQVYQGAVLKIQQHLRTDATPVLPSIRHFLNDFQVRSFLSSEMECFCQTLLPQIHRVLFKIVTENLRGRRLLEVLCSIGHSGLPILQSCAQRLLWHCNQVLYNQLMGWYVSKRCLNPLF